jgi:hypothetical protein
MTVLENVKALMDVSGFRSLLIPDCAYCSRIVRYWMKAVMVAQVDK